MVNKISKWQHHLTRPMTIFSSSLWHEWYVSKIISDLVEIEPLSDALFIEYPKGTVACFRDTKQLKQFEERVEKIVLEKPNKMEQILLEGLILIDEARENIADYPSGRETLEEAVDFQVRLGQQTANLPRLTLNFIEKHRIASSPLIALAEKLRSQTIYPDFTNKVVVPLATKALGTAGIKNSEQKVSLTTYWEIENRQFVNLDDRLQEYHGDKLFVYEVHGGDERIIFSNSNDKLLEQLFGFSLTTKKIKGTVAFRGKVTGRVSIVLDDQVKDFLEGDILVSINSSPRFMPYIIKCGGIITDEGGLGCHAAIISRELKKPCIIGTKIATQVLKDGDLVEVDAEKGVVKRLEK